MPIPMRRLLASAECVGCSHTKSGVRRRARRKHDHRVTWFGITAKHTPRFVKIRRSLRATLRAIVARLPKAKETMQRIACLTALVLGAVACSSQSSNADPSALLPFEPPAQVEEDPSTETPDEAPSVSLNGKPIRSRLVRLTHAQWEHSVRDLLRLEQVPGLSTGFTGDPPSGTFSNNERALSVTPDLWLDYQRAAEDLSQRVTRDPAALARLYPDGNSGAFIANLGRRAYRRALSADEQARYQELYDLAPSIFASGDARADGAQLVIETLLQSPHFVYRTELGEDGALLSPYEIASKLSFLLRDTTPSDELLDAAASGSLDAPESIGALARQMVESPEAADALARFHGELFGLDRYLSIAKDPNVFPDHDEAINPTLARAEELFLNRVVSEGLGLDALLTSTVGFANEDIAPFYGVEVSGQELAQVDLGPERPGLFTRLGFLAYNGTLRDPDSIHRGVEINRTMLCATLSPPPGIIPALPVVEPGQTNRERVNAHTGPGTCGDGCHSTIINPIGFAFENFDSMGQLRDTDNGKPVDTSSAYRFAEGLTPFNGAPELMALLADSPQVHACYAREMAEFGLQRDIDAVDRKLIGDLQRFSLRDRESIKELLVAVVTSPAFVRRSSVGGEL
jgi:hypothetical protein